MKKIVQTLKSLSVSLTWKMFRALVSRPLLILPTSWATVQSILYSEKYFDEAHGGRGVANAYRHAAWNLLIAKNASFYTSPEKAIAWAKFITDMHEECFPNEPFDNLMDLQNNRIGREIFEELNAHSKKSTADFMKILFEKTEEAVGLQEVSQIADFPNVLVFYQE